MSFFRRLLETREHLSEHDLRRGKRLLIADGACSMGMVTLQGGPFLPAFAIALGATNYEVGLLVTIAFASQFMQLAGLYLVRRFPYRRGLVVAAAGVARLLWLPIILIPVIFAARGVTFLMQWLVLATLVGAMAGPAWNSLLRDLVPPDEMGRVFSTRLMLGTLLALGLTLMGGYFVDFWGSRFPEASLYAYSILFAAGLVFGLVGVLSIYALPEPTMPPVSGEPLGRVLRSPLRDSNFRRLLSFIATWNFAVNMAGPFFIVYMLVRIGLSLSTVTALAVTSQATNILFLRIWGRLADRYSNKSVLAVSGPLFLIAVLAWTFTTMPERHMLTMPLLFGIHVLIGMSSAGTGVAAGNIGLKLSPQGEAPAYMTLYGLAGAVTGAMGPMVGGVLADFFAARQLAVQVAWSEPAEVFQVHALNLRSLDFLFLAAFLVGLYALRRLARVTEAGEVDDETIRRELLLEVFATVRSVSASTNVRLLVAGPLAALSRYTTSSRA